MERTREKKTPVTVDRHYRLSKAAYEKILNRDLDRFPTEKDFLSEAVLSYDDRVTSKELLEKLQETKESLERVYKLIGWH